MLNSSGIWRGAAGRLRPRALLAALVVCALLSACGPDASVATSTAAPTSTLSASDTPLPSATPSVTSTASPRPPTATASRTPRPSQTPRPTGTPTEAASDTPEANTTPEASATSAVAATLAPATLPPATAESGDFAPVTNSFWDISLVSYTPTNCSNTRQTPYGLVLIAPADGGLLWNDQGPDDYVMSRLQTNVYQYAGPTLAGDGSLTLGVTFTDARNLAMTRVFAPSAEPDCRHTYAFQGVFVR